MPESHLGEHGDFLSDKYAVYRRSDLERQVEVGAHREPGEEVEGCFVLRPATDIHAYSALAFYVGLIRLKSPGLARDLQLWLDNIAARSLQEDAQAIAHGRKHD